MITICGTIAFALCLESANAPRATFLLDEVSAGSARNVNAIEAGTARYKIVERRTIDPGSPAPPEEDVYESTVKFNGDRATWTCKDLRCLRDGRHDSVMDASGLGSGSERPAYNYVVNIEPLGGAGPMLADFHPRYLAHGLAGRDRTETIASVIRGARATASMEVDATEHDGLITVRVSCAPDFVRHEYIVDRSMGYSVTAARTWSLKITDRTPAKEMSATYRAAFDGGPFIASKVLWIHRRPVNNVYVDGWRREATLLDAVLDSVPSEDTFTLAGLGVPKGASVVDKETGKHYLYGIDAVTDDQIDAAAVEIQKAQAEKRQTYRLTAGMQRAAAALMAVLLIAAIALMVVRYRRQKTRI